MVRLSTYLCFALVALLVLAGCGATPLGASNPAGISSTATTSAAGTVTPIATSGAATATPAAGTSTGGAVVITTDHATYASTAGIQVTMKNGSATTIGAYDHQASCSIFALETQVNGAWQSVATVHSSLAACSQGKVTTMITVKSGDTYHADIQASPLGMSGGAFPPGQYRLRLTYTTTPAASQANKPVATDGNPAFTTLYSAALTVA